MRSNLLRAVAAASLSLFAALPACKGDPPAPPPPCIKDADCGEGELCAMDGNCVEKAECTTDMHCGDLRKVCDTMTFKCVFRDGFADECDTLRPCDLGKTCSRLIGKCIDDATTRTCTRRSDCPANQICDRRAFRCIPDPGCFGAEFCEEGEICDLITHTCVPFSIECTACMGATQSCEGGALCHADTKECVMGGAEPSCDRMEFCDPLGRCVQCTRNEMCGPGLYCNAALGRCEAITQCAPSPDDCPDPPVMCLLCKEPLICNPRTKRCEAPAIECEDNTDCPHGQYCDKSRDPPICVATIPECLNDVLDEPMRNDRPAQARLLDPADGPRYQDLKVCPADVDWYKIEVPAGTYVTIDARFEHEDGDIDVQLLLEDGRTLLDESRSTTDNERVEIDVGTERTLLVRVFLAVPVVLPVPYTLVVARDPGTVCADDMNEPDDGLPDAKPLVSDVPYQARLCSADPDWYAIRGVPAGQRLTVRLDFTDNLGDLDMELYRSDSPTTPLLRSVSEDDDEVITYDASFSGDYYVRVFGKEADTNVYTIRAEIRRSATAGCRDDALEPNNDPSQAIVAPDDTGPVANLTMCAGDDDWFVVNLGPGESLMAEIGFSELADLELKLYPPGGSATSSPPIEVSQGFTSREFIAFRAPANRPGDYLIRVQGRNASQIAQYELRIRRDPPFICEPDFVDVMGRGMDMATAYPLPSPSPTRIDDVTLCSGEEDWYEVQLPAGFRHVMRLHYVGDDADLDFALFQNGNQLAVTQPDPEADFKEISGNLPGFGLAIVHARVFNSGGLESRYSLVFDTTPIYLCLPDFQEVNDLDDDATPIVTPTTTQSLQLDGTMCVNTVNAVTGEGDRDWFTVTPTVGWTMSATLTHPTGDLSLGLWSPGVVRLACPNLPSPSRCFSNSNIPAPGGGWMETITFTATVSAPYYFHVDSIYSSAQARIRPPDAETPYTLDVSIKP